jgi:hypothetical protein
MKNIGASVIYGRRASISLQDGKIVYVFTSILCALSMIMSNNCAPALWVLMHQGFRWAICAQQSDVESRDHCSFAEVPGGP